MENKLRGRELKNVLDAAAAIRNFVISILCYPPVLVHPCCCNKNIGLARKSFRFVHKMLSKNLNKLLSRPISSTGK